MTGEMEVYMMRNYGLKPGKEILASILTALENSGANWLSAEYSGGNDEGGVTLVSLVRGGTPHGDPSEGVVSRPSYTDPIWELCEELLMLKFGTWAGEYEASGSLLVDRGQKRAWTEGSFYVSADDDGLEIELEA